MYGTSTYHSIWEKQQIWKSKYYHFITFKFEKLKIFLDAKTTPKASATLATHHMSKEVKILALMYKAIQHLTSGQKVASKEMRALYRIVYGVYYRNLHMARRLFVLEHLLRNLQRKTGKNQRYGDSQDEKTEDELKKIDEAFKNL